MLTDMVRSSVPGVLPRKELIGLEWPCRRKVLSCALPASHSLFFVSPVSGKDRLLPPCSTTLCLLSTASTCSKHLTALLEMRVSSPISTLKSIQGWGDWGCVLIAQRSFWKRWPVLRTY